MGGLVLNTMYYGSLFDAWRCHDIYRDAFRITGPLWGESTGHLWETETDQATNDDYFTDAYLRHSASMS